MLGKESKCRRHRKQKWCSKTWSRRQEKACQVQQRCQSRRWFHKSVKTIRKSMVLASSPFVVKSFLLKSWPFYPSSFWQTYSWHHRKYNQISWSQTKVPLLWRQRMMLIFCTTLHHRRSISEIQVQVISISAKFMWWLENNLSWLLQSAVQFSPNILQN